jgi:hypothetical protein
VVPAGDSVAVAVTFDAGSLPPGEYMADIQILSNDPDESFVFVPAYLGVYESLLCGDVDSDGVVNVADVLYMVEYIFNSGPAPSPRQVAEVNCDGKINLTDIVYVVAYIFNGGPEPCADCPL